MVDEIRGMVSQSTKSTAAPRPQAGETGAAGESGKAVPPAGKPRPAVDTEAVRSEQVRQRIRAYLTENNRSLNFRVDENSGRTIITVFNEETGEVVREIPPEQVIEIAKVLGETTAVFFRATA